MTYVEQLAAFVTQAAYEKLSQEARQALKIHVLDALGCAIGAVEGPPLKMLYAQLEDFGGNPLVSLIGGGKTAPDRAALYNSALVRYLDYNDSYLARGETCHPSDNLGAVLAATEYAAGRLSHWKGLAYPNTAFDATHVAFLAMRGITGPLEVFEGNKGFMESIAGKFEINWQQENLEAVTRTSIKKYNAEFHSQSVLEGILELRASHQVEAQNVDSIEIEIFDVAFHIIGGGEEGDKQLVRTKEEADHSLPYMVAVALLDGEVSPAQYTPERIMRQDVQTLLRKVTTRPNDEMSKRFPAEMPCRIHIVLKNGQSLSSEKRDYEGFYTRPMSWEMAAQKFERLASPYTDSDLRRSIEDTVERLEAMEIQQLTEPLAQVRRSKS
ncbi:MAG: MmgE/PrpD family protein [Chloroflexi bacterium]|nr:MAG: MmgE/PrpD family protein [Chloroflexota bacterium]